MPKFDIEKYLSSGVISKIREEIERAGGNEVYFVGRTNDEKVVVTVEAAARGNSFSVVHIQELAERSDVVIHNHPSGELIPSVADNEIAFELANDGIASYIVNNQVTEIYPIVEPFEKIERTNLEVEQVVKHLEPGGSVSQKMPQYEHRPQQIEMIRSVAQAFNEGKIAVIEAGTGVGKSLAYLIPAIIWSVTNSQRCAVSTRTINLQEQLINKDIPFLKKALGLKFDAVLVKGRSNYVCLRKVDELKKEGEMLVEDEFQEEINLLLEWVEKTSDGSKADLNFIPKNEVWELFAAEADNCQRKACPFFAQCFVMKARRRASKANILVVNHHLLFADLSLKAINVKNTVLPRYDHLIFDEAHDIEEVAVNYFGGQVTRYGISRTIRRLFNPSGKKTKGFLPVLVSRLKFGSSKGNSSAANEIANKIVSEIYHACDYAHEATHFFMDEIAKFVEEKTKNSWNEIKLRLTDEIYSDDAWGKIISETENYFSILGSLSASLSSIITDVVEKVSAPSPELESAIQEVATQTRRLKEAMETMNSILSQRDDDYVRWIEVVNRRKGRKIVRLQLAPLNISHHMKEFVYDKFETIVMTSATLCAAGKSGNDFDFFYNQVGLHDLSKEKMIEKQIPASFDYQKQAILAIPNDLPNPDSPLFGEVISDFIFDSLKISKGRAFVLFTSYGLLQKVYKNLRDRLVAEGITVFRQGELTRDLLLTKFKKDINSVLFATDSFWHGVDVEGEALENVIITKLPFKVPSEPYMEAKAEYIERNGGNAFMDFSLPIAILKLKQGFGRLIRKKTDIGVVFILDKRILEKYYGRFFLHSLPNASMISDSSDEILRKVEEFFKTARKS